jgi:molybdopterin/thiamine biosynthesis adenylyltransferase
MRYIRNRIYINESEQIHLKYFKILLAGCGIGSVIAECALRLGFENITIIDGDQVELSNLNRQNYINADIGVDKTKSIKKRLLAINPDANITIHNFYLTETNIDTLIRGHHVAINALDFKSNVPLVFDDICQKHQIPVLHPYNIGWAGLVYIIMPQGESLREISIDWSGFEKKVVKHFLDKLDDSTNDKKWILNILKQYENEKELLSPPQLSVGSWLLGSLCTSILFDIAMQNSVKQFPEYYFLSTKF